MLSKTEFKNSNSVNVNLRNLMKFTSDNPYYRLILYIDY